MSDQERLAGYVEVWWSAVNDFIARARAGARRAVDDADRPARLGRARRRLAHRPPREHPGRQPRGDRRRRRAGARHRLHGALHRDRRRQPLRPLAPTRSSPRSARRHRPGTTALLADPPTDGQRQARGRSSAACRGAGRRCCATARSTSGCTSRTYAAPSAAPGAWTRAAAQHTADYLAESSASCSPRRPGAAPARPRCCGSRAATRSRFTVNDAGRGERLDGRAGLADRQLAMDRESFVAARGRTSRRRSRGRRDRRRPVAGPAGARTPMATTPPVDAGHLADIGDQSGRTVVVTGPSLGGLGHHTALELARRGARVVLAGRTAAKLDETRAAITPEAAVSVETLVVDLSSWRPYGAPRPRPRGSGRSTYWSTTRGSWARQPTRTVDGLDLQLATNHFGPFLLTGLLLPQLVASATAGRDGRRRRCTGWRARRPLGDPRVAPAATDLGRLRPVQARQPALHRRARPAVREAGAARARARRPPRLRRHPPGRQRPVRPRLRRRRDHRRRDDPGGVAVGRGRRLADADGRDRRPPRRHVRRPPRAGRVRRRGRRSPAEPRSPATRRRPASCGSSARRPTGLAYPD